MINAIKVLLQMTSVSLQPVPILHRKFTSGYLCTIALILFIHIGFLEYLSFKQFKLIVKMTTIESRVTIPKGLFTLYLNVKKVTAKKFWPS
jgi:hypothetical protein